jgi:predicted metal-dependent phosphoesterase TrpH
MLAAESGASAIAVTDHDTVSGIPEARRSADQAGIEFIAGLEISAEFAPGTMHILGYAIDDSSPELRSSLDRLKQARANRNPQIASRLQQLGCDIGYEEVAELAGNEVVGRPHFARLLVRRGYASSIQDAFNRYLAKGAPAHVEKARLSPAHSVELIHNAGGVAVLAHPYQLGLPSLDEVEEVVGELADLGLDGIEAIYSRHNSEQRTAYSEMAARHGLLVTGGSDFHGSYKPDISIVKGTGDLKVPYELLTHLKERARERAVEAEESRVLRRSL